jgi:hypothetical protein
LNSATSDTPPWQLPILDFVAKALRLHRARQSQERLIAGSGRRDAGFVFTTRIDTPVDPANLLDDFKRILGRAELPEICFHDLRHSAASLLLALNVHPRMVMELLGHSQISLTMNTYSHVVPGVLREAVDKLAVALGQAQGTGYLLTNPTAMFTMARTKSKPGFTAASTIGGGSEEAPARFSPRAYSSRSRAKRDFLPWSSTRNRIRRS